MIQITITESASIEKGFYPECTFLGIMTGISNDLVKITDRDRCEPLEIPFKDIEKVEFL